MRASMLCCQAAQQGLVVEDAGPNDEGEELDDLLEELESEDVWMRSPAREALVHQAAAAGSVLTAHGHHCVCVCVCVCATGAARPSIALCTALIGRVRQRAVRAANKASCSSWSQSGAGLWPSHAHHAVSSVHARWGRCSHAMLSCVCLHCPCCSP